MEVYNMHQQKIEQGKGEKYPILSIPTPDRTQLQILATLGTMGQGQGPRRLG